MPHPRMVPLALLLCVAPLSIAACDDDPADDAGNDADVDGDTDAGDGGHTPQGDVPQIGEVTTEAVSFEPAYEMPEGFHDVLDLLGLTVPDLAQPDFGPPMDTHNLPWTYDVKEDATLLPALGRRFVEMGERAAGSPDDLAWIVAELAAWRDPEGPTRRLYEPVEYALDSREPLFTALQTLATYENDWPDAPDGDDFADRSAELQASCSEIPLEIQRPLARLILRIVEAYGLVWEALERIDLLDALYISYMDTDTLGYRSFAGYPRPLAPQHQQGDRLELEYMLMAAQALVADAQHAAAELTALESAVVPVAFAVETPHGEVVIDLDGDDDIHEAEAPALIVDTGGNDVYRGHHAATIELWQSASVVVDLDGNDRYWPDADPAAEPFVQAQSFVQGAGFMGVALLYDLRGDDEYRASVLAQGYGAFGVGLLVDGSGSDYYAATFRAQGGADFGVGALIDFDGGDEYHIYSSGQGFGWASGVGLLLDTVGEDDYFADAEPAHFEVPSYQGRNMSAAQGVGFGRRGDSDGTWLAGGVGALVDLAGNDDYLGDNFVQGVGFWYGTGLLCDVEGDDTYQGFWWLQGSSAHFALGLLADDAGNDTYRSDWATGIGVGHDMGIAALIDSGGDDEVFCTGLGLGAGNDTGVGMFLNLGGSDTYHAPEGGRNFGRTGLALDRAEMGRGGMLNVGIFVDQEGTDTYDWPGELGDLVGNDMSWILPGSGAAADPDLDLGGGIDR